MAEKVGRLTGKKTQAGRDVYETPEGEMVSEKSTTFMYKGKWINIPSIHDGYKYEDDILRLMLDAEIIEPTSIHDSEPEALKAAADRSDKLKFSKGGTAMNRQMEMAFMQEGGMKDDGMDKDPVSGNDIPAGSLAKEVRDDIPAQLSEGEYVVPADVVQYYGVKFFEDLRREAKMGLAQMDKDGRIGGEPISVTMIALGEEEKKKKAAMGGVIGYQSGGITNESLQAQQAAANPLAGFQYTGQSLSQPLGGQQPNIETKTYYHSETGAEMKVVFKNGIVDPPDMLQYTQPPWSLNKPSLTKTSDRDDDDDGKPKTPPGWGVDSSQYNFENWTKEKFEEEVNSLLTPSTRGGLFGGMINTTSVANAKVAIALAEAKGVDKETIEGMNKKYDEAFENLNAIQQGFVSLGTSNLEGVVENIFKYNPTAGNPGDLSDTGGGSSKKDRPVTTGTSITEQEQFQTDGEFDISKALPSSEALDAVKQQKIIDDAAAKIDKDDAEAFEDLNKGGLLKKPKRKPKKPRGKGLASK